MLGIQSEYIIAEFVLNKEFANVLLRVGQGALINHTPIKRS